MVGVSFTGLGFVFNFCLLSIGEIGGPVIVSDVKCKMAKNP